MSVSDLADRIDRITRRLVMLEDDCGEAAPEAAAVLERFETKAGVRLPEQYRAFMLSIRRLPAIVPFYGMVPPGHSADRIDEPLPIADLAKPFPLAENWIWEDDPEIDFATDDWPPRTRAKWEARAHGLLWLGTDGCALHPSLIVTGERRGEIWDFADVGLARAEPGGSSFLDWLEHRIDAFAADKNAQSFRNKSRFPQPWWSYV